MFLGWMDYKNSMVKKMAGRNKVDPGTFSFLEPGWWVLHAATISAAYTLGKKMSRKNTDHMH
ncbi:MAG: hypothetical protein ACOX0E_11025 [Syntrophomonadaceae bacterium]